MPTGLHKLRGMVRDTWRFCNWTATQLFELREDMNRLMKHQGCPSMPCSLLHLSSQTFQSTPLVRMRVRRALAVHWLGEMCLLPNLKKKTLSHSVPRWTD
jgi:presenilin-like A22 family membrane protease